MQITQSEAICPSVASMCSVVASRRCLPASCRRCSAALLSLLSLLITVSTCIDVTSVTSIHSYRASRVTVHDALSLYLVGAPLQYRVYEQDAVNVTVRLFVRSIRWGLALRRRFLAADFLALAAAAAAADMLSSAPSDIYPCCPELAPPRRADQIYLTRSATPLYTGI